MKWRSRAGVGGFSLIELMMAVVILGVLATIAMVSYRRWIGRARKGEVSALLAEITAKEQVYRMEFGVFHPLRRDNNVAQPSPDEAVAAFFPRDPNAATFESTRTAVAIGNPALWPQGWRNVGLRPRASSLFCTYLVNTGWNSQPVPVGATIGVSLLSNPGDTAGAWFYALGVCNFNDAAGYPNAVTIIGVTHSSQVLREINDGR